MPEPINSVDYWRRRLAAAPPDRRHEAVFRCGLERWQRIEARHREILACHVRPDDSILDAGCGWGRLLDLLPADWHGYYCGADLSPDFIALARQERPGREFVIGDLRTLDLSGFDLAILISIRPMVLRNLGEEAWTEMEMNLRRAASRILLLEYDEQAEGEFLPC